MRNGQILAWVVVASVGWFDDAYAAPDPVVPVARNSATADVDARITKLIADLGNPAFAVRDSAQRELARLGFDAFDALNEATTNADPEIAAQAQYLVRQLRFDWVRESDPAELREILQDYEGQAAAERLSKIHLIANRANLPKMALPALEWLCRLARFEESELLAKEAALKAMAQEIPAKDAEAQQHIELIATTVARGRRPAVQWLKNYVLEQTDPAGAAERWTQLLAEEEQRLDRATETSQAVLSTLARRQVALLDKLGRKDQALATISKLVDWERGDARSLLSLVDWLRERQAWQVIDQVVEKFAAMFDTEPVLLYALAQARMAQGETKLAEELADKAFAKDADKVEEHFALAAVLQERGLKDWSDREYRFVIDKLPPVNRGTVVARLLLSEDLHDRQREADAAEVLKPIVELVESGKNADMRRLLEQMDRPLAGIKSRMLYFEACAVLLEGDAAAHAQLLEKAIAADPTDADVLIALHRLPEQTEEQRSRTQSLINHAAEESRQMIEEFPEDATAYNQYAWLVGNTGGDVDDAIAMSHKSIEIRRAGGYLDTLAHCYFAKGDFENAVKYQTEAAELEPHSQLISRQLNVFKQALEKSQTSANP